MKSKLIGLWKAISIQLKWWMLLLIQVWIWPQFYDSLMPANIAIPLFFTTVAALIFNVIKLVNSYDEPTNHRDY